MTKDLTDKIDLLISLAHQQGETLTQQGKALAHLDARLDRQEHLLNELALVQRDTAAMVRGIDKRLDKLEDRMIAVTDSFAEVRAAVKGQVPAAEFYELRGRVEEISRRLPTPIAYTPPKTAAE